MELSEKHKLKLLTGGLALLLMLLAANSAQAHPADLFYQSHSLLLTPDELQLTWSILPGPVIVPSLWRDADQNQDELVSPTEARAWVTANLSQLTAQVGDAPVQWQVQTVEWPTSVDNFQTGDETIVAHLTTAWPAQLAGAVQFSLHNQYQEPITINWFSVQSDNGITFHLPQQKKGALAVEVALSDQVQPGAADSDNPLLDYWDSGTPSLEAAAAKTIGLTSLAQETAGVQQSQDPRSAAMLTNLLRSEHLSVGLYLLAFGIAGVLGALHALTPGHGKTVVAAYLVGTRGTTRHAVSLGAIVTLTHTGSVFALGLVALIASRYILPTTLFPVLEIASGMLIVGLGTYLLYGRWQAWRTGGTDHDHHDHDHLHHHDHDHSHHHHSHDHDHDHSPAATGVTRRSLITLGISGGLVPCPDAIAILLVAITVKRIALGLSLIVAFSLGLALVLIVIGLALVHSRRLVERVDVFDRVAPIMPVVSAVIVLLLGLVLTYTAIRSTKAMAYTLETAATVPQEQTIAGDASAGAFDLDQARILFLVQDDQKWFQLAARHLTKNDPLVLSQAPLGLQGYTLSPDTTTIVYTMQHENGGTELWSINSDGSNEHQLLACPLSICANATWSPDGQRLVYERSDYPSADNPLGLPSLWWLDFATGHTKPVFPNSGWPGYDPTWSPDGQWLSYTSPGSNQIVIYNLTDGRRLTIPNHLGNLVTWKPDASSLLVQDMIPAPDGFVTHLLRYDLADGQLLDLSEEANADDRSPAWSPDGQWIALTRRELSNPDASETPQIWIMRADGSQAHRLTTRTDVSYDALSWSPDGKYLLFQQYLTKPQGPPEIWLLNVQTGEAQQIISPGRRPAWLP